MLGTQNISGFDGIDLTHAKRDRVYFCLVRGGIIENGTKYVIDPVTGVEELYDLGKDPNEENNIENTSDPRLGALREEYVRFNDRYGK